MAPLPILTWKVLKRTNLTHDVFELKLQRPEGFKFRAGQYISIIVPGAGPGGRNLRRAYSIASPPNWNEIELCIKLVENGPGTNYLNSLKEGDSFEGQAPLGDFTLAHDQSLPALFIGTGTGIAPLRAMVLSDEWKSHAPVGFLLGVRHEQDILYPEMFPKVSEQTKENARPEFSSTEHVKIVLSRPSDQWTNKYNGFKGRVTHYLREMSWDFQKSHYYLCGSGAMIQEVKEILAEKGVEKAQIHTEKYF